MIALTQEKREEKIKRLNKIASWADSYGAVHNVMIPALEAKEMAEAYIASLTAEPEFYVVVTSAGVWQSFKKCRAEAEFIISRSFNPNYKIVEIFTAPPVPEVNTSNELTALLRAIESFQAIQANDRWNESGKLDDAYGELSEAAIKALPLIKRLNGLGE